MVRTIFFILSLLLAPQVLALTKVTATVDKNPATVNESLILTVVADDNVDTNALDTSALLTDFIVGRTSVSTQTSMVNFNTSRTTTWTTVLIPRTQGTVTIPALSIEGIKSQPISLRILAANDPQAMKQQDLFIDANVSAEKVYVQQMFTLTVKLFFAAELQRGSLTEPQLSGAAISQVGEDKQGESIINGRMYRVIERVYAITPQQSGNFTLTSPMFSGEILTASARRSNFMSFNESKPVSVLGKEFAITVSPIPAHYKGQWLPSELLSLHEEWQPDSGSFLVGEPITRTVTLTAVGLSKAQLPNIDMALPTGLKVYPDQATQHSSINDNRLVSQSVQNFAIVANQAGEYQLPEISIPWWNTVTNKLEKATLPAQTITVKANPNAQVNSIPLPNSFTLEQGKTFPENDTTAPIEKIVVTQVSWLQWLFLGLWVITLIGWWLTYRHYKSPKTVSDKSTNQSHNQYLQILAACKKNQGDKVLSLFLPWINTAKPLGKHVANLDEVIVMINHPDFAKAMNTLQSFYFGKAAQTDDTWCGNALLPFIQAIHNGEYSVKSQAKISLNP